MCAEERTEGAGGPGAEGQGFEGNLKRLEEIVAELEEGNLPLDRSLRLYEEGIGAYRTCQDILQRAQARVTKLVETLEGELKEEPFELPGGSQEAPAGSQ